MGSISEVLPRPLHTFPMGSWLHCCGVLPGLLYPFLTKGVIGTPDRSRWPLGQVDESEVDFLDESAKILRAADRRWRAVKRVFKDPPNMCPVSGMVMASFVGSLLKS